VRTNSSFTSAGCDESNVLDGSHVACFCDFLKL
jgi:hypothetical protein